MKILGLLLLIYSFPALSCSIFRQIENSIVAKNFDWSESRGELIVRPVAAIKHALNSQKTWVSRYGSVTFNQYGPDLPTGGINTEGLMIEALILGESEFPKLTSEEKKEALNEAEFMQYVLDQYQTVDEVLTHLAEIKMIKAYVPVHYFLCDASKKCAVIDYIKGKPSIHQGDELNPAILTNLSYRKLQSFSSNSTEGFASHVRFQALANYNPVDFSLRSMLEKLNQAKIKNYTAWQIFYSLEKKTIDLYHVFSPLPVSVELSGLNFSCQKDLDVLSFEDQDQTFSQKSIKEKIVMRANLLDQVDPQLVQVLKNRPLVNHCYR